jgi:hypothetical protein
VQIGLKIEKADIQIIRYILVGSTQCHTDFIYMLKYCFSGFGRTKFCVIARLGL